jgi:hypothetical protein
VRRYFEAGKLGAYLCCFTPAHHTGVADVRGLFNPSALAALLEGGVVQMATVCGASAVGSIVKALRDCTTCKRFEISEVVQEIKLEEADKEGRAVVKARIR